MALTFLTTDAFEAAGGNIIQLSHSVVHGCLKQVANTLLVSRAKLVQSTFWKDSNTQNTKAVA